ncbi:hypothetical protein EsH8_V_000808 [Colletotrichum jinshuiense]
MMQDQVAKPRAEIYRPAERRKSRRLTTQTSVKMPAINTIVARDVVHQLAKRQNWANQEAGVIVVFCIVFIVASGVIGLLVSRCISRRKAARQASNQS